MNITSAHDWMLYLLLAFGISLVALGVSRRNVLYAAPGYVLISLYVGATT